MELEIRRYQEASDYDALLLLIRSEGSEWKAYTGSKYKKALKDSLSYVAYTNDTLCAYLRSIEDCGIYFWVVDLLVHENFRGRRIGKQLLDVLISDLPDQEIYVMSDADAYYQKLGYSKEGSVFRIH